MKYWIGITLHDGRKVKLFAKNAKERDLLIKGLKNSEMIIKVKYNKINKDGTLAETKVVKV